MTDVKKDYTMGGSMRKYILLGIVLIALVSLYAQKVDGKSSEYGFQMLKIPTSVAVAGTGGTGAFYAEDAFAVKAHPTAGVVNRTESVSLNSTQWLFDTQLVNLGISHSSGKSSLGLMMRYLDYGDFENRDDQATLTGEYHPMDLDIMVNYGYRVHPDHFVGVNISLLYEKINTASCYGVSGDLGYTWLTPFKGLKAYATIKNIGTTSEMSSEKIEIPMGYELGFAKDFSLPSVTLQGDMRMIKYEDDDNMKMNLGVAAIMMDIIRLRAGYKINYDIEDVSAGIGIHWKSLGVDYTWIPIKEEIGDVHMIGLTYDF